jgi:hypothetical protein
MTRRFLRVTVAALALFLTAAGSMNLRQANAGLCDEICGCNGGPHLCCEANGIRCFTGAE